MKKFGFTFLELIIGIAISSILSFILFMAYYQTQKSSVNLERITSIDSKSTVLQNQLEKDISGVFVPDTKEVKPQTEQKETKEAKEGKESKEAKEQKEKKEEKSKFRDTVEKVFFAQNQGKTLKELTFITCNPLQIFGQSTPRIVRVWYALRENKQFKNSFSLFRRESTNLDYKEQNKAIEYELVDNVKDLSIEFAVPEVEKEAQEKKQTEKKEVKKAKKFKVQNDWMFDGKNKGDFLIPMFVTIKVDLWEDLDQTGSQSFTFKYLIFAFDSQFRRLSTKEKGEESLEAVERLKLLAGIKPEMQKKEKEDSNPKSEAELKNLMQKLGAK